MARVFDPGEQTAAQGCVTQGVLAGDNTGMGVSFAGDVDGDGVADFGLEFIGGAKLTAADFLL